LGQRTSSETLIAVIVAFWRQPVWSQADLAREAGVSPRVARRYLDELTVAGWPLEREEDHPHVYWSVPKGWFPAGVLLDSETVASLVRGLVRVPPSEARSQRRHETNLFAAPMPSGVEHRAPMNTGRHGSGRRVAARLRPVTIRSGTLFVSVPFESEAQFFAVWGVQCLLADLEQFSCILAGLVLASDPGTQQAAMRALVLDPHLDLVVPR
jgi:hypothetical protein